MSHTAESATDDDFPTANDDMQIHTFACDADGCAAEYDGEGDFSAV